MEPTPLADVDAEVGDPSASGAETALDVLVHWRDREPPQFLNESVADRVDNIMALIVELLSEEDTLLAEEEVAVIRTEAHAGDGRAIAAAGELQSLLVTYAGQLLASARERFRLTDYHSALNRSLSAIHIGNELDRRDLRGEASFVAARCEEELGNMERAYDWVVQGQSDAVAIGNRYLHGVMLDRGGMLAMALGFIDEAVDQFEEALELTSGHDRQVVLFNLAKALVEAGQARTASEISLDVLNSRQHHEEDQSVAILMDGVAQVLISAGEPVAALELARGAEPLFPPDDHDGRMLNSLIIAAALRTVGDMSGSGREFKRAREAAFEHSKSQIDHRRYWEGLLYSIKQRIPIEEWMSRIHHESIGASFDERLRILLDVAAYVAGRGDLETSLSIRSLYAQTLAGSPRFAEAVKVAWAVRQEANLMRLAGPEISADALLGSLEQRGLDTGRPALVHLSNAVSLLAMHRVHLQAAGLTNPIDDRDSGMIDNELGKLAAEFGDYEFGAESLRAAASRAMHLGLAGEEINRVAGLRDCLKRLGRTEDAYESANRIHEILYASDSSVSPEYEIQGERALADQVGDTNQEWGIRHLSKAVAAHERDRQAHKAGIDRSRLAAQFGRLHHDLASRLRRAERYSEAFQVLQGGKARSVVDVLAARANFEHPDDSRPTVEETQSLLVALDLGVPSTIVDLQLEDGVLTAYVVSESKFNVVSVEGDTAGFVNPLHGDQDDRVRDVIERAIQDPLLAEFVKAVEEVVREEDRLLIIADGPLLNLPLHAIPYDGVPWYVKRRIGYLPAAGVLRFRSSRTERSGVSLVAGDSRGDLPYAAEECRNVALSLGEGDRAPPLLGIECSVENIRESLSSNVFDVVHLAVHGRGDLKRPGRANLLLSIEGATGWIPFDELVAGGVQAELVVLSGCSTAVAGRMPDGGLGAVSMSAQRSGAAAVVASLWPVDDEVAKVTMTAFHRRLAEARPHGPVDLRLVLDDARLDLIEWLDEREDVGSVRRGGWTRGDSAVMESDVRTVSHLAAFVVMGDPIIYG